jgi:hypothetical protein
MASEKAQTVRRLSPLLANKGNASTCYIERRKTKGERGEVNGHANYANYGLLADSVNDKDVIILFHTGY